MDMDWEVMIHTVQTVMAHSTVLRHTVQIHIVNLR